MFSFFHHSPSLLRRRYIFLPVLNESYVVIKCSLEKLKDIGAGCINDFARRFNKLPRYSPSSGEVTVPETLSLIVFIVSALDVLDY